ncbi:hypothetical protein E2C01_032074 [Portunus trituberculatus]|uniref:Uncharacterized protein n=1 Tax=Portunus trituberculatus TaxID=210409 RepID=A0A5B7EYQ2_PORTR|nr:hypothetical protein [Portunus trituberculatus]
MFATVGEGRRIEGWVMTGRVNMRRLNGRGKAGVPWVPTSNYDTSANFEMFGSHRMKKKIRNIKA